MEKIISEIIVKKKKIEEYKNNFVEKIFKQKTNYQEASYVIKDGLGLGYETDLEETENINDTKTNDLKDLDYIPNKEVFENIQKNKDNDTIFEKKEDDISDTPEDFVEKEINTIDDVDISSLINPALVKAEIEAKIETLNKKNCIYALDIRKTFGKKEAVKGISFFISQGEVVGFLGPNGAGKTTSFYMVVGFIKPTRGNIYLGEMNITKAPMFKRAKSGIAYLPQEASVFRKLSVEDNINSVLETRSDLTKSEKKETLEFILEELSIADRRKQKAYTLSGGERRRTEIARALAINPKFLLLDEPFAGIDPIAVHEIKIIIEKLKEKNIGVLITDHNVRDTLEITDRSYIVKSGDIIVYGSKKDIINNPIAKKAYLGENFKA